MGRKRIAFILAALSCGCRASGDDGSTASQQADRASLIGAARDAVARDELRFTEAAGEFRALNRAQGFAASVDRVGAHVRPASGGWSLDMHVVALGRTGALSAVAAPKGISARNDRIELSRDGMTEWYVHDARGLEQGIDLAVRPNGAADLEIEIAVDGLSAKVEHGEIALLAGDAKRLTYGGLSVKDASGRSVAGELAIAHGNIVIRVHDQTAQYPLAIDPMVWGLDQGKIVASDGAGDEYFGSSVSVSGGTAVVGATRAGYQGAAYVFVRSGSAWTQQAKLVATDGVGSDMFGSSVSVSGGTVVVGAPRATISAKTNQGAAYVFTQSGTTWTQRAKLVAADGAAQDLFGQSVAVSGTTVVVGSPSNTVGSNTQQGAAYVYGPSGTTWTFQQKLASSDGALGDLFGTSVSVSGGLAVVGAAGKTGSSGGYSQGQAYVFALSGTTWTEQAKLVGSDSGFGDQFGTSVSIAGTLAIVGAPRKNTAEGAAYVFAQSGTTWTQQSKLMASDITSNDNFGYSVSISGSVALVSAFGKTISAGSFQGAAYLFSQSGTTWSQQKKLVASDGTTNDYFGVSVALSGPISVVGAKYKDVATNTDQGAAYVMISGFPNGDPCPSSGAVDCISGICADGVCCDSTCTGTCRACTAAKKGSGANGTCGLIAAGADPDGECPTTCTGTTLSTAFGCTGSTPACAAVTTSSCAPYQCGTAACKTTCATDADCDTASYCKASACVAKVSLGAVCTAANQCASGFCADGVCCNSACTSNCQTCLAINKTSGADGACGFAKDGVNPRMDCAGGTCSGASLTARVCNGAGSCRDQITSCAPYMCNSAGTACATKCTTDGDCGSATKYCATTGLCEDKLARGKACTSNGQCASAFCADGFCCNVDCTGGACQACGEPGNEGSCVPVKGAPRPGHPTCTATGTTCGGTCDGVNPINCHYPGAAQTCGDGCKDAAIAHCDGAGMCTAATACPGNFACADGTSCKSTCAADSDCAGGYTCKAGACSPAPTVKCSPDGTQSVPVDTSKAPIACAPYRCNDATGNCYDNCTVSAQCATGSTCDTSTSPAKCVPPAPAAEAESDGGCTDATSNVGSGAAAWGAIAALALVTRRRRRS